MFGLGRRRKKRSESFSKQCFCGEIISGMRTQEAQRRTCAACGELHSFLPLSPYPTPRMPRGYVPRVPVEEDRNKLDVEQPEPVKKRVNPIKWLVGAREEKPKKEKIEKIKIASNTPLSQRLRSTFSPIRMLIAGSVLILVLTAWYVYHRRQIGWAEEIYSNAALEAEQAFQEGEFDIAKVRFAEANEAALILGLTDKESRSIKQYHEEFELLSQLTNVSLFDVLSDKNEILKDSPNSWAGHFLGRYSKNWLLLDVRGELVHKKEKDWVKVDCPVIGSPAVMQLWLPVADQGNSLFRYPDGSVHLIAGAKIRDCRKLTAEQNQWAVVFSDVLIWNNYATLEMAGLAEQDEELNLHFQQILKMQASVKPDQNKPEDEDSETETETEEQPAETTETENEN